MQAWNCRNALAKRPRLHEQHLNLVSLLGRPVLSETMGIYRKYRYHHPRNTWTHGARGGRRRLLNDVFRKGMSMNESPC